MKKYTHTAIRLTICSIIAIIAYTQPAFSQTGSEIFAEAGCGLLYKVITQDFGALLTVLSGSLAILAAVQGSFKGAWAMVFVSVGSFVFPITVGLLFPGLVTAC